MKEMIKCNVKIIEKEVYLTSLNKTFKFYICKRKTKNGVWREFKRFNAKNFEKAMKEGLI